jgi:predicted ATPase
LVTSQAPLHVLAERVFKLGPLAVPEADTTLVDALRYGAVALFAERARAADRHFVVDDNNLATVKEICRSLDGLALAIELAAARLPLLGVKALAQKLDERLRLLVGGSTRAAPTRQQTLRAALDWSHGLLTAAEGAVFRRLGVFVGGFTLTLAAKVAGEVAGDVANEDEMDEWDVIDILGTLVDRCLVAVDAGQSPRYRLLESARAYALERLDKAAELELIRRRHAQALCALAEQAEQSLWTTAEVSWLAQYAPELGNLRAAVDWATRHEPGMAVALLGASYPLFACLGLTHESRERSAPLVGRCDELQLPGAIAARFLRACSLQVYDLSVPAHHGFALRAVQGFRKAGDARGLYEALHVQTIAFQTFFADAQAALHEMESIEQPHWPRTVRALACIARSRVASAEGRMDANRAQLEAALDLLAGSGADRLSIVVLANLANHVLLMGPLHEAVQRGEELVALLRRMRRVAALPLALCNLANAHLQQNATAAARRVLGDAFASMREQQWLMLRGFGDVYALLAACEGRFSDAARLLGWADEARKLRGERQRNEARCRAEAGRRVAAVVGATELHSLMADGVGMDEDQVCHTTLRDLAPV